jgi:hypothetical protein
VYNYVYLSKFVFEKYAPAALRYINKMNEEILYSDIPAP